MHEVALLAQNLARNCGYAVFPVGENKHPRTPNGFKDAEREPDRIARLWGLYPGELIGLATGEASGISVLDVDQKHIKGALWWRQHCSRLLPTLTYETRSGGLHLYFRHADGVRNSQGKLCEGIDTRGQGGYIIYWFAAGFGCFDPSPPAPWPAWLTAELTRPSPVLHRAAPSGGGAGRTGLIRRVETAKEGERNGVLFWAANRLLDDGVRQAEAEVLLLPAAAAAGLASAAEQEEARRSIASAYRRRVAA